MRRSSLPSIPWIDPDLRWYFRGTAGESNLIHAFRCRALGGGD